MITDPREICEAITTSIFHCLKDSRRDCSPVSDPDVAGGKPICRVALDLMVTRGDLTLTSTMSTDYYRVAVVKQ